MGGGHPACVSQCLSPQDMLRVGKRQLVLKLLQKNVNIFSVFIHQVLEQLVMFSKGKYPIQFPSPSPEQNSVQWGGGWEVFLGLWERRASCICLCPG